MLHFTGQHRFLELLCRGRHRSVALPERVERHTLVLQIDDRLRGVPTIVGRST